jgi:hypothetical protein
MRRFLLRKPLQRLPPHPKGGQKPKDNGDDALFLPTGIVFRLSVQKKEPPLFREVPFGRERRGRGEEKTRRMQEEPDAGM